MLVGWPYYSLYVIYLVLFLFVIMNTICGLFVEATINRSHHDEALLIQSELDRKDQYVAQLQNCFRQIDVDKNGLISDEEFLEALIRPEMQAFLGSLHIDASDAESFFRMLTEHCAEQEIDLETFVVGCIKLRGEAKAMDVYCMLSHQMSFQRQINRLERLLIAGLSGRPAPPRPKAQGCGTESISGSRLQPSHTGGTGQSASTADALML